VGQQKYGRRESGREIGQREIAGRRENTDLYGGGGERKRTGYVEAANLESSRNRKNILLETEKIENARYSAESWLAQKKRYLSLRDLDFLRGKRTILRPSWRKYVEVAYSRGNKKDGKTH